MDYKDKVAIVTGAANGIGRASAMGFAQHGAKVVLVDRDAAGARAVAGAIEQQGGKAIAVGGDVTKSADVAAYVKAAMDTYGRIDCFHNNAGIEGKLRPIAEYDEADWDQVIAVNVKGVFLGLRHVLPHMIAQRSGAIVNTGSIAGIMGTPNMAVYVASKHAVLGIARAAAIELAPGGVRVNCLIPGFIDTPMMAEVPNTARAHLAARIPQGRLGASEEMAQTAAFLLSDAASHITGQALSVDGGVLGTLQV